MMAKFMKGTSMEVMEAEMQRIPGFRPRKSGVIRSRYSLRDLKDINCPRGGERSILSVSAPAVGCRTAGGDLSSAGDEAPEPA